MPLPDGVTPRKYQYDLFHMVRDAFKNHRAVLAEAATGSGKSVLMALIVDSFLNINKRWKLDRHLYFLVDENYLLFQFSDHLTAWLIPHDTITSGKHEGRPVNIHVATVQSLRRRPPQQIPVFFVVDEAHFSTSDSFMDLFNRYPEAKILGMTASPETGSGKGLAADWLKDENGIQVLDDDGKPINAGNGIFDIMIESPVTMRNLTEGIEETDAAGVTTVHKYLAPIKYYGVPMKGIENLHMQAGDYKLEEVEKLLREKGTFGDSIKEMQKFPHVKSHILYFCKSVKACYEMQIVLQSNYYTAEVLEGRLTKKERRKVMKNFAAGKTQILITCKMVLKGVDLPWLLMAVDCAPVAGRGTQRQKVGRIARLYIDKNTGFTKKCGYFLDMVANHRVFPGSDIYAKIDWNFASLRYNKKPTGTGEENVCPLCFALIPIGETICPECGAARKEYHKKEKKRKHLDGDLVEIVPVPLSEREDAEKQEITGAIHAAIVDNDIEKLIEIGKTVTSGRNLPYWIYYKMRKSTRLVDVPLVYRIQRSLGYKPGWAHFFRKNLKVDKSA